jgi:ubiquinone/menaquinone biosynthesis C-methylase UbiE
MSNNNEFFLSKGEKQILDAILSLEIHPYANKEEENEKIKQGEKLSPFLENIHKRAKLIQQTFDKQAKLGDWTNVFETLLVKGFIQVNGSKYELTNIGGSFAKRVRRERIGRRFSGTLVRSDMSKAHSSFCHQVFGKDLCQANMMDMEQLEKLLEVLNLTPENKVLDLACGVGRIAEHISDVTQAYVLGIDIALEAIKIAQERTQDKKKRLEFQIGDLNDLDLPQASVDTIIAIASLHYADDLAKTIGKIKDILPSNGQMGLFNFQYCFNTDSPDVLLPENTHLAQTLKKYNLSFQTWDFTDKEMEIRRKQIIVARELMEDFRIEGNEDLCKDRIEECEIDLPRLENGMKRRYLYHVKSS